MADSEGRTTYVKHDVPKGNYKLKPYVFYRTRWIRLPLARDSTA